MKPIATGPLGHFFPFTVSYTFSDTVPMELMKVISDPPSTSLRMASPTEKELMT